MGSGKTIRVKADYAFHTHVNAVDKIESGKALIITLTT